MLFRIFIYNKYLCFFRVTFCQFSELIIVYNIRVMARLIIKNDFKAKSVEISDEPLGCQVIFSDMEPQFNNDDGK